MNKNICHHLDISWAHPSLAGEAGPEGVRLALRMRELWGSFLVSATSLEEMLSSAKYLLFRPSTPTTTAKAHLGAEDSN